MRDFFDLLFKGLSVETPWGEKFNVLSRSKSYPGDLI